MSEETMKKLRTFNARCLATIVRKAKADTDAHLETLRAQYKNPKYDLLAALRYRRCKWLGQILRLEQGRLLRQMIMDMRPNGTSGTILMDAPKHQTMEELAHLAGGVDSEESRERARLRLSTSCDRPYAPRHARHTWGLMLGHTYAIQCH